MGIPGEVATRGQSSAGAGALETLAVRARETPEEPWLFHRPEWTWRWRSYVQVADQVARGAAVFEADLGAPQRLAVHARQHPDAVAVALALMASGRVPVVSKSPASSLPPDVEIWAEVGEPGVVTSRPSYALPRCHSDLEVWEPQPLGTDRTAAQELASMRGNQLEQHSSEELLAAAHQMMAALHDADLGAPGGRAIVATGPALGPFHLHAVLTWSLWNAAAWVMEPQPEAFAAAVEWTRPTVVVATGAELERLASALGESRVRRRARLRAVVALGAGATAKAQQHWQALGVAFRALPGSG